MKKCFCDKCGKEIGITEKYYEGVLRPQRIEPCVFLELNPYPLFDVCENCVEQVKKGLGITDKETE